MAIVSVTIACGLWLFIACGPQPVSPLRLLDVALLTLLFAVIVGQTVIRSLERIELGNDFLKSRVGMKKARIAKSDINRVLLPVGRNIVIELKSGERIDLPGFGGDEEQSETRDFIEQWRKSD